jgi:putative ABC transport system ATP-binding protein
MPVLEASELYRFFRAGDEEIKALRGVDFALQPGVLVALLGPSGSGKSTLLMCLAGIDEPDGGKVSVMNKPMTRRPEAEKSRLRAKYLGVMRQKNNLLSHLTVAENIAFAQAAAHQESAPRAAHIMHEIGIDKRAAFLPGHLSGGERARAGVAVALASEPKILLLDEPTGEVDARTEEAILRLLVDYCAHGGAAVAATHSSAVARAAGRICTMKDGKISDGR